MNYDVDDVKHNQQHNSIRSIPHTSCRPAGSAAARSSSLRFSFAILLLLSLSIGACSKFSKEDRQSPPSEAGAEIETESGFETEPPELAVGDFAELGFSLDSVPFAVNPDSATRRIWPNGYRLETATWRGESGFPRIMINVLDVTKSGESFTSSSALVKPMSERINDLLPGELIDMRGAGRLKNEYGLTSFQMFNVDSRMSCAFVNQFLTKKPELADEKNFGEIVVEAILCDQNTAAIDRTYLQRFTNAWRIGKSAY